MSNRAKAQSWLYVRGLSADCIDPLTELLDRVAAEARLEEFWYILSGHPVLRAYYERHLAELRRLAGKDEAQGKTD